MKRFRLLALALALSLGTRADTPRPLPTLETVVAQLRERQARLQPVADSYLYTEHTVQRLKDKQGRVTETETADYEITRAQGHLFKRLVRKNGQPLTDREAAKEEARIQKQAEQAFQEGGTPSKKVTPLNLLKLADMTTLSREPYQGAERLVLTFRPRKDVKTKGLAEEIASKLEGRLYLDETTYEVLHFEGRLTAPIKIWGGLVGSVAEGSTFSMDMAPVDGALYMPSSLKAHLVARQLFWRVSVEMESTFSDYRKPSIEGGAISDVQTLPPPSER